MSKFHDHLAGSPITFNEAKGAFQGTDATPDKLLAQADDGANGSGGTPDSDHTNNANMNTPPDGQSPTMQMYLFGDVHTRARSQRSTAATTPRSSTTSTRTGSPTGWSSTRAASAR